MSLSIESITQKHCCGLLAFETDNRHWFESLIQPRPEAFYSISGVNWHIEQLLTLKKTGAALPFVVTIDSDIVGRVNVKDIDDMQSAWLGYRFAQQCAGQGVATKAVGLVLDHIQRCTQVHKISAQVLSNNPASAKVLEKNGFVATSSHPNWLLHKGSTLAMTEYERLITR